jgi:serine/threonine protein kinase
MTQPTGSQFYIAPEMLYLAYTNKCDIWAIGVVAFACLYGRFPFDDPNPQRALEKICSQKLEITDAEKLTTSKKSRKFLRKLLKKTQEKRFSVGEALEHSWLNLI